MSINDLRSELFARLNAVQDRDSFGAFIDTLRKTIELDNAPYGSTNGNLDQFLEAMGAWTGSAPEEMIVSNVEKRNVWRAAAELLYVGYIYE